MPKIYESPDGGETIYERDTQTGERIKIHSPKRPEWFLEDHEFYEINQLAKDGNKALQNLLKEVKLVYSLIREPYDTWD